MCCDVRPGTVRAERQAEDIGSAEPDGGDLLGGQVDHGQRLTAALRGDQVAAVSADDQAGNSCLVEGQDVNGGDDSSRRDVDHGDLRSTDIDLGSVGTDGDTPYIRDVRRDPDVGDDARAEVDDGNT